MFLNRKFIILYIFVLLIFFSCKIGKLFEKQEEKKANQCLITLIEGRAYLVDENYKNISELKVGLNINENDIVKTEKGSTVELQIGDKSLVRVKENSILKIVKLFKDQTAEETKINLDIGKILAKPKDLTEGSSFEIETKSVTAGVRGTEFTVVKTEEGVAKIAVNEGAVSVVKNIDLEEIKNIEKVDKKLGDSLNEVLKKEVLLEKNEKIEVNDNEYESYKEETLSIIKSISEDLEKSKDNKKELSVLIKEVEEKTIIGIEEAGVKVIKKDKVTDKEWQDDFNKQEFKKIGVVALRETVVEKKAEEEKVEKIIKEEDKNTSKQEEEKNTNKMKEDIPEEKKKEIIKVEKLTYNLGINLSEKNTATTVVDKYLCITNDLNKTIYCIDPENGEIIWEFTHSNLNKVQSPAVAYKNKIILATYNNIFVLNSSGKIILNKEISNGPLYWASPILHQNKIFIPTARHLYYYNGQTINQLNEDEFPIAHSQLYIGSDSKTIFVVDSLSCCITAYDFVNKNIVWRSDKLPNNIFTPPVRSGKYLIAADIKQNLYRFDYNSQKTKPDILKIDNGVLSNVLSYNNNIYFAAKDGLFYNVDINNFNKARMIMRVDKNPVQDKYLTKKLFRDNNIIYFASDTGKIFTYNISTGNADFIDIEDNINHTALIGTPVKINKIIYFVDLKSNMYKLYKK